jgi:hypothetical protein
MSEYRCRACVLFCMDFRLHGGLDRFLKDEGLDRDGTDLIRVAGAARALAQPDNPRDREWLLEQLGVSHDLHQARQIYVINHEDCGAYGPEQIPDSSLELEIHRRDLRAAGGLVRERFPDVEVIPCFMWLGGRADRIID